MNSVNQFIASPTENIRYILFNNPLVLGQSMHAYLVMNA